MPRFEKHPFSLIHLAKLSILLGENKFIFPHDGTGNVPQAQIWVNSFAQAQLYFSVLGYWAETIQHIHLTLHAFVIHPLILSVNNF